VKETITKASRSLTVRLLLLGLGFGVAQTANTQNPTLPDYVPPLPKAAAQNVPIDPGMNFDYWAASHCRTALIHAQWDIGAR
jgi:hypothetical protein